MLPDTGLHPRPGHAEHLKQFFPEGILDEQYRSTVYASRSGESVSELQARCDLVRIGGGSPGLETDVGNNVVCRRVCQQDRSRVSRRQDRCHLRPRRFVSGSPKGGNMRTDYID